MRRAALAGINLTPRRWANLTRDIKAYERNLSVKNIEIIGVFEEVAGGIEPWEKVKI